MRIAHIIDYFHTDVLYQEFYLAKSQAEAGHEVRVIASNHRRGTVGVLGDESVGIQLLGKAGVEVVRPQSRQLGHDRVWIKGLKQALRAFRPEVVQCHGAFGSTTVRVAQVCAREDIPLLVDNHTNALNSRTASRFIGRQAYQAYNFLFGPLLQKAVRCWVAVGPEEAAFLTTILHLAEDQIELIPLGFDPKIFSFDSNRRSELRLSLGWKDDAVVVVTGRLTAYKRVDILAKLCDRMAAEHRVRLVLAGSISDATLRLVTAAAPTLSESGRLHVLPMLDRADLAELYLLADLAIFPYPSISIFEASGTGLSVALARDPYAEWIHQFQPAIRPYDPGFLDLQAMQVVDRSAAARRAHENFSWPVISDRFVERYRSIQ
jgi:glycosyltransferase involved in cell wall biosynthesis